MSDTVPPDSSTPLLSVGFILLPHFTLLPFAAFVDALRLAADEGDLSRQIRCRWSLIGPDRQPVQASCGVELRPWEVFPAPQRFDYLAVVGGILHHGPQADNATLEYLRTAAAAGVTLIGLCTGSFTLIRAGLLRGRRCCVSWFHYQDVVRHHPEVTPVAEQLFVEDGRFITCAGGAPAADLAARLIERHCGRALARKSLHIMGIERPRPGSSAQPLPPLLEQVRDERVRRAMLLLEQNLSEPPEIDSLARRVNLSRRQLERMFQTEIGLSPREFSRQLRLRYGLWLLVHSQLTITAIAQDCGFADTAHFSREFRRKYGKAPSAVRADPVNTALIEMRWGQR